MGLVWAEAPASFSSPERSFPTFFYGHRLTPKIAEGDVREILVSSFPVDRFWLCSLQSAKVNGSLLHMSNISFWLRKYHHILG
ncbi:hypothetical protein K1719_032986 [Acacia pycnantha]|nr:hypothetical protein K1719_032986 [Acacia pycnantha]